MENKKEIKPLNIYAKLNLIRTALGKAQLKKSGRNAFAGFDYYQLNDFIPTLLELEAQCGVFSKFDLTETTATLEIINIDIPEQHLVFSSPVDELSLKGANAIQNIGGTHTYLKRYLYLNAYEIVEPDKFDAEFGKNNKTEELKATKEQLKEIEDKISYLLIDKQQVARNYLLKTYNVKNFNELTKEQAYLAIKTLNKSLEANKNE